MEEYLHVSSLTGVFSLVNNIELGMSDTTQLGGGENTGKSSPQKSRLTGLLRFPEKECPKEKPGALRHPVQLRV